MSCHLTIEKLPLWIILRLSKRKHLRRGQLLYMAHPQCVLCLKVLLCMRVDGVLQCRFFRERLTMSATECK